jgi:uncharacterized membrane protein
LSRQETEATPRRPRPRLETLSDLIYGLSLSIGAISLVISNSQSSSVGDINKNILEFLFVFLILITSWLIYTSDMSVLPIETRLVTFLNILLLMLVAIIPYLFDQAVSTFNSGSVQDYASILFTADLAGTLLIMTAFASIIASEEEHLVDSEIMLRFRRVRKILGFLSIVVLLSLAVPWSWLVSGVQVRLLIWYVPIISFWIDRMRRPTPFGIVRSTSG